MAKFGSSFTYNGKSSEDFGIILCAAEAPESIPMGLTRETLKGEITNNRPVANWYSTKYSDVLTYDITVTKIENEVFSRDEIRKINAWLTGPKTPTLLSFKDDETEHINYYGVFTDTTNIYASGLVMLTYTFTADSPYGWSDEQIFLHTGLKDEILEVNEGETLINNDTISIKMKNTDNFIIENTTDELNDFIYPLIKVTSTPETEISIENLSEISSDLVLCKFSFTFPKSLDASIPLYIDSKYHQIYYISAGKKNVLPLSDIGFTTEKLNDISKGTQAIYWPRLVPGMNKFIITSENGECDVEMTFRCPRKVGAY